MPTGAYTVRRCPTWYISNTLSACSCERKRTKLGRSHFAGMRDPVHLELMFYSRREPFGATDVKGIDPQCDDGARYRLRLDESDKVA